MTEKKRIEIIANHNLALHSAPLNADRLYYEPIIAWCINLTYKKENPLDSFFLFAIPITVDDGANDRDNYAIINRETNEWWIPPDRFGSNIEELKALIDEYSEEYQKGLDAKSAETETKTEPD